MGAPHNGCSFTVLHHRELCIMELWCSGRYRRVQEVLAFSPGPQPILGDVQLLEKCNSRLILEKKISER